MLKKLIDVANKLDKLGLYQEADGVDHLIKVAEHEEGQKILYVMRGLPGSGKSTAARNLPGVAPENIFSTDDVIGTDPETGEFSMERYSDFFKTMKETRNFGMIGRAHQENQRKAIDAMRRGVSPIVVDNTNVQAWEAKPYVEAALQMGYEVNIVDIGTGGVTVEQLAERNTHGVPQGAIEGMLKRYQGAGDYGVEEVLESKSPFEK